MAGITKSREILPSDAAFHLCVQCHEGVLTNSARTLWPSSFSSCIFCHFWPTTGSTTSFHCCWNMLNDAGVMTSASATSFSGFLVCLFFLRFKKCNYVNLFPNTPCRMRLQFSGWWCSLHPPRLPLPPHPPPARPRLPPPPCCHRRL